MKASAKCPHCGRRLAAKSKPPDPKRERLKMRLHFLSSELSFLTFENGRAFEQEQEHRLALLAIFRTNRKLEREQRALRLKIAKVERQLRELNGRNMTGTKSKR
jgi:predicted  nucleic acid-binding Zn-ribbon protein